ncbi:FAD-dependent oxidoreductase, partial [Hansschlegelia beijingensis]
IVGGGGHGLAAAHYLAKEFGVTNVAVVEKGWIGGGNVGRNTTGSLPAGAGAAGTARKQSRCACEGQQLVAGVAFRVRPAAPLRGLGARRLGLGGVPRGAPGLTGISGNAGRTPDVAHARGGAFDAVLGNRLVPDAGPSGARARPRLPLRLSIRCTKPCSCRKSSAR